MKMPEHISNHHSSYPLIQKLDTHKKANGSLSIPISLKSNTRCRSSMSESDINSNEIELQTSTATTMYRQPSMMQGRSSISPVSHRHNVTVQLTSPAIYASPTIDPFDDIGLEIIESKEIRKSNIDNETSRKSLQCIPSVTTEDYEENDTQQQSNHSYPSTPPRLPPPLPPLSIVPNIEDESNSSRKRSLPMSIFLLEISALVVVFIVSMVLVSAIREEQENLRTTMQFVYTYIYLTSIIWMIWCIYDILKFRRQWLKLTSACDQEVYMDIVERHPQSISYFPDIHNTGGLFMRFGAGLLCMGSLLLTAIELAKIIEIMRAGSEHRDGHSSNYPKAIFVARSITFIFRFLFHCVQFTFLFRYGNIIIDRYHFLAKIGLIHIVIANFCTWFEAIVNETVEELHKHSTNVASTYSPITSTESGIYIELTTISQISFDMINFLKAAPSDESSANKTKTDALEFIEKIESILMVYLYPCLIEYSLICVTVFYIMWRNIGNTKNRTFIHFGDRHIFTVNCSRASGGLLIGGIILVLTILTLIPNYLLDTSSAIPVTHITEFVLLIVSLLIVCLSFVYTTKLYYDRQAHVDTFDQILILITTVGDFAYSLFGLYASIFIKEYTIKVPRAIEILTRLFALFATFLQSSFILDALKRRTITKAEIRNKPGRELITALLLTNLAIWLHDSLSAKKATLNPLQTGYYDPGTWSIIQAFTSPLSIFYRFHSSVCLADIWQEVYQDDNNHRLHSPIKLNNNQHS